jgi:hypothetical protein
MAVGALVVPGLVTSRPVQAVAGGQFLIRIEMNPTLGALFLRSRVPGDAERLQPATGHGDQVLLQRIDAERVGDLVLVESAVRPVGSDQEFLPVREKLVTMPEWLNLASAKSPCTVAAVAFCMASAWCEPAQRCASAAWHRAHTSPPTKPASSSASAQGTNQADTDKAETSTVSATCNVRRTRVAMCLRCGLEHRGGGVSTPAASGSTAGRRIAAPSERRVALPAGAARKVCDRLLSRPIMLPNDPCRHQGCHDTAWLKGASMSKQAMRSRTRMTPVNVIATIVVTTMLAGTTAGSAQTQTPTREGNESNFRDWQPNRGEVSVEEHAAGIRPSPAQRNVEDQQLKSIYQQLMGNERTSPPVTGQGSSR